MTSNNPIMNVELVSTGTNIRCYVCGSTQVVAICHHCGRPMCSAHGPVKPTLSWFTENREFVGIDLGTWPITQKQGAHCEFHVHSGPNYRRIMIGPGVVILIMGIISLIVLLARLGICVYNFAPWTTINNLGFGEVFRDPQVYAETLTGKCYAPSLINSGLGILQSLIVLVLGAGSIVIGRRLNQEKIQADIQAPGVTLPVGVVSHTIQITETLEIKLEFDHSDDNKDSSFVTINKLIGKINPQFHFMSGLEAKKINQYKKKYHISESQDLHFQAGYLLLCGGSNIQVNNKNGTNKKHTPFLTQYFRPEYPNLFRLGGWVSETSPLNKSSGAKSTSWEKCWEYSFSPIDIRNWNLVPVRIIPYIRDIGNNKKISLEIQINTAFFKHLSATPTDKKYLDASDSITIENLEITDETGQFGRILSDGVVFRTEREDGAPSYKVRWQPVYVEILKPYTIIRNLYQISFEKEFDPHSRLKGKMRIRIPALFSGIERIEYYSALGYPIKDKKDSRLPYPSRLMTYLDVEFDLALSQLPVANLVLKDFPIKQDGKNANIEMKLDFAPTPEMIERILTLIQSPYDNDQGFLASSAADQLYVYQVVESQPQMSLQDDGKWHWDISARMYKQMQPIDIHLVIYGDSKDNSGFVQGSIQTHINPQNAHILSAAINRLERIKELNAIVNTPQ